VLGGSVISMALVLAGFHTPVAIFLPMILVALGNGLSLPNGIAGAMSINPALAGTAAGLAGFMQMGLGAALSQSVGAAQVFSPWASLYVMAASAGLALLAFRWILVSGRKG